MHSYTGVLAHSIEPKTSIMAIFDLLDIGIFGCMNDFAKNIYFFRGFLAKNPSKIKIVAKNHNSGYLFGPLKVPLE